MSQITIATIGIDPSGVKVLTEASQKLGVKTSVININNKSAVDELNASSKLIIRIGPKGYYIYEKMLPGLHYRANAIVANVLSAFNKASSMCLLTAGNVPMPRSELVSNMVQLSSWEPPYVLKVPVGNQGEGVYLVSSAVEAERIFHEHKLLIAQELIEEAKGSDKRLFVVGNEVISAMRRQSVGDDFRANVHQGGIVHPYTPTSQEIAMAVKASGIHKLSFSGVDMIDSLRGPLVLEVNPSPGFAIQAVSDQPIAERIIKNVIANTGDIL